LGDLLLFAGAGKLFLLSFRTAGVDKGVGPPSLEPEVQAYYWDTLNAAGWMWEGDGWEGFANAGTIKNMTFCRERLHIVTSGKHFISMPRGGVTDVYRFYCGDSIWIQWESDDILAYDFQNNTLGLVFEVDDCAGGDAMFEPQVIQGMEAFCLADLGDRPIDRIYCDDLHSWGMLGTNGKWLIPPKFDAPFRFQDGFAEVLYYGKRRKINVLGEFVE
jgi:hypothetical protein